MEKEARRNAWNYKSIKNEKKNETTSPDQTKRITWVKGMSTSWEKGWGLIRELDGGANRPTWVEGKLTWGKKGWGLVKFVYGWDGLDIINNTRDYVGYVNAK